MRGEMREKVHIAFDALVYSNVEANIEQAMDWPCQKKLVKGGLNPTEVAEAEFFERIYRSLINEFGGDYHASISHLNSPEYDEI